MRLEWFPQALCDFYEIIDYIAEDNPLVAIEQGSISFLNPPFSSNSLVNRWYCE